MTRHTDMFRGAVWDSHLIHNGEVVGWRPLGVSGSEVSVSVVFTRRSVIPQNASDARQFVDGGDIRIREADLGGSTVNVKDTVNVDSKIFSVTRITQRTPVTEVNVEHRDDKRIGNRNRVVR